MKKTLFLLTGFLLLISGIFYIFFNSCRGYSCLSFENKNKFLETEQTESTSSSYKGVLTKGNIYLRVEVYDALSKEAADRFTEAKVMQLQGLFEIARSPYPGVLSNEIECEDKFKPVVKDTVLNSGTKATIITGYLNDRLQYGSCLDTQITHIGKTAMFYCQDQKKWYYFEAISKKSDMSLNNETTHLIQSLKCQKPF